MSADTSRAAPPSEPASAAVTIELVVRLVIPADVLAEEVRTHARSSRPLPSDPYTWRWSDVVWMGGRPGVYVGLRASDGEA